MAPLRIVLAVVASIALADCATTSATTTAASRSGTGPAIDRERPFVEEGEASWYSDSLAGHHTASGVPYEPSALTAAHRRLPFGTVVRVTRLDTRQAVTVTVNDRGPYAGHDRIIDLSHRAAHMLDLEHRGVARVRIEVLAWGDNARVRNHRR